MEHPHYSQAGFIGGALTGLAAGIKFFFLQAPIPTLSEVMIKLITTILLAGVGGIAGMLAKDLYIHWMQPWLKNLLRIKKNNIIYKKKNK